ncbi:MAG: helix-turn-helix domain-containing protein [Chloroflexi bacterium]|nr:helix-turn-helix domain-containing protein [Chloroflexota bacterium]
MAAIQNQTQQIAGGSQGIERLLSEHDVAAICGLSDAAVRRWRLLKKGPRYIKVGSAVRYRLDDVQAWLETRPSGGEGARQ